MKKALFYGILALFLFAFTFVLNRNTNLAEGYWLRAAYLHYLFTLPMLVLILAREKGAMAKVWREICLRSFEWALRSTVGFGLFYAPLTFRSMFGEPWLATATWQLTVVMGVLLIPLFGRRISVRNLPRSLLILTGIFLLQVPHLKRADGGTVFLTLVPILVAAFSYPLGNRKMMACCPPFVSTIKKVFGMTLCSVPLWLLLSLWAAVRSGLPGREQVMQSLCVTLFSDVVATVLFFRAMNMVKHSPRQLAAAEATQYGEVVSTLLGGIFLLQGDVPDKAGLAGITVIVAGMIGNSLVTQEK